MHRLVQSLREPDCGANILRNGSDLEILLSIPCCIDNEDEEQWEAAIVWSVAQPEHI